MGTNLRTGWRASLAVVLLMAGGCGVATKQKAKEEVVAGARRISAEGRAVSREELGQMLMAYADWYVLLMADACDRIKAESPDSRRRMLAQELKTWSASSVYDIVTNPDPYTQLFDLTAAVTLQSINLIDEDNAEELFGPEQGKLLIRTSRRARLAIWHIAAQVLTTEQLENLDFMIWDWRRENPDIIGVINVRFDDFAGSRGKSLVKAASTSGMFASIDAARQSAEELRMLGERTFFYGKRAPLLLAWRTEAAIDEILAKREVQNTMTNLDKLSRAAERAAVAVENMPASVADERKALLQALDEREGRLHDLLKDTRATLADADSLARDGKEVLQDLQRASASLQELLKGVDAFSSRYLPAPATAATSTALAPAATQIGTAITPSGDASPATQNTLPALHAFDIREYTQAITELATAARELNTVVTSSRELLGAKEWSTRIDEINAAADERVRRAAGQSRDVMDNVFVRIYIAMGAPFLTLVVYKVGTTLLMRKVAGHAT